MDRGRIGGIGPWVSLLALAWLAACGSGSGNSWTQCERTGTCAPSDGCMNVVSDRNNCGACGHACSANQVCANGLCVFSTGSGGAGGSTSPPPMGCSAPLTTCGTICTDTLSDANNCGGCNRACPSGDTCQSGFCTASTDPESCAPPKQLCGGITCSDLAHDPANCLACGQACTAGQLCGPTGCTATCKAPLVTCGRACVDPSADAANCGGCGHACGRDQTCTGSTCRCPADLAACGAFCVDTMNDEANCGSCDHACGPGEGCITGVCGVPTSRWTTLGGEPLHSGFNSVEAGGAPLSLAWRQPLAGMTPLWPAVSDGKAVYVTQNGANNYLWALSADDGHQLWSYNFGSVFSIGQATLAAGRLYVAQCNNTPGTFMFSLSASAGTVKWTAPLTAQWEHYWAPLVVGARMYFNAGTYGGLYGLSTASGSQLFFNDTLGQFDEWSPIALGGRIYTFVAGNLRAHDPDSGAILATTNLGGSWFSVGMFTAPISDGTKIYLVVPPNLQAFRPDTMQIAWSANGSYSGMPAVANGTVYAISSGGLRGNDAATGATLWTFPADGQLSHPPVVAGQTVYAASDANVYAVDTTTHQLAWTATPGGWLSIAGGALYVAQPDGALSAYRLSPQ
jgi:outer membrane protein assembly factor BamB